MKYTDVIKRLEEIDIVEHNHGIFGYKVGYDCDSIDKLINDIYESVDIDKLLDDIDKLLDDIDKLLDDSQINEIKEL
jgi:hypothetical protein